MLIIFPILAGLSPVSGPTDRGNEAFSAGRYDDALKAYRKAAEDEPGKAVPHYNLGNAYYKKGGFEDALTEYRRAIALDPKMADAYYNAGDSLFRLGRYEEALKSYRQADALKPGDRDTGHNIAVTLKRVREKPPEPRGPKGSGKQAQGGGQKKGGGQAGTGQGQQQPMSNEELQALLEKQAKEEKQLRHFFKPGQKKGADDRESEIEQMLRGFGLPGTGARPARPGAPYVEKDW